jgi:hypothetical protein
VVLLGAVAVVLAACSSKDAAQVEGTPPAGGDDTLEPEDQAGSDGEGKFEAWNSANNPAYVDSNFSYFIHQLPVEGHGPVPIPSDYWATAHDNLNTRWDGENSLSPAEKYAKAFNKPDVPKAVSENHGIKANAHRKACKDASECSDQKDGSTCAKVRGEDSGYCIPTWWGICHGWAPYALSEPAAKKAVDKNGVTFYPGDIEGLMSLLYTRIQTKFISQRCNKDEPPKDSMGRLIDGECRDMNPGSWHVVVTNKMGLRKEGFVLDQTYDDEVWNQPAYSYKITNADNGKIKEITKADAVAMLGAGTKFTALLPSTEIKKDEQKAGEYAATADAEHTVKLSGTGDADLYVKKGAAPTTSSYDCRPYGGTADEECKVTLKAGEKVFWMVVGYSATSNVQLGVGTPDQNATYTYNTAAKRFFHVLMDFSFVVEARPARESHVDNYQSYMRTKSYEYIVEADDQGKIIGGEWLGSSRTDHPDFVWWPTGKPMSTMAGNQITYSEVKALNDLAAEAQVTQDTVTVIDGYSFGTSTSWRSKYASVVVEPGYKKLEVKMTGDGDADLYVRAGSNPTVYSYTCKSVTAGTSNESCSIDVAPEGKTYFVRARTKTAGTKVTVVATKTK